MVEEINSRKLVVCEVGSRNVSPGATTKRTTFFGASKFIGVDVHMAGNVDVAGDAHYLHELIGEASVDGVFSMAVMEHLSFPWLFAASVNRTLRLGGLTFHLTHRVSAFTKSRTISGAIIALTVDLVKLGRIEGAIR